MSRAKTDLAGRTFGRLTALHVTERRQGHQTIWRCRCECGEHADVSRSNLLSGNTRSCGCLASEAYRTASLTHGHTTGRQRPRLYTIWSGMKDRCSNPRNQNFRRYGGRGIAVCEEWLDFAVFHDWARENGYRSGLTLDRIDNDGPYSPGNCRWVTRKAQAYNTSRNRYLKFNGKRQTVREWAEELDMRPNTLTMRLRIGWSVEKALTTPVQPPFGKHPKTPEEVAA